MLAVVGNVAFGVEAGENGVAHAPPRLLDADEGGAGQHGGDHGQVLGIELEVLAEGGAVAFAARAARIGAPHAIRSDVAGAYFLELGAIAVERRERILPQARFHRRLRLLEPLVGVGLAQPHQVIGMLSQERRGNEQGHDAEGGNRKGGSAIACHLDRPMMRGPGGSGCARQP